MMIEKIQHINNDQLQAYLDGVLESASVELVQTHLEDCPICREELSRLEIVSSRLDTMPEIDLQRDLSQLVIEQLKEEQALSPAVTWILVVEALATGGVIGVLIPALQAAGWLPRLLEVKLALQAGLNIFLAQLASNWLVWWAGLKLQISQAMTSLFPLNTLSMGTFSPWILIGLTGALIILINAFLLSRQPLSDQNHNQLQT